MSTSSATADTMSGNMNGVSGGGGGDGVMDNNNKDNGGAAAGGSTTPTTYTSEEEEATTPASSNSTMEPNINPNKRRRPNNNEEVGDENHNYVGGVDGGVGSGSGSGSGNDNTKKNGNTDAIHQPSQEDIDDAHPKTRTAKTATKPKVIDVPWGPVFYPTVEDMKGSPLVYLEKIRPVAQRYGIAKIVPPKGWSTDFFALTAEQMDVKKKFSTKKQYLHRLQEGISFGDGEEYNPASYQQYASKFTKEYKAKYYPEPGPQQQDSSSNNNNNEESQTQYYKFCPENLEQDYWELVENRSRHEVVVEYGNDVDTNEFCSGFPLSRRGRSTTTMNNATTSSADRQQQDQPEPEFGTEDYYKETWWNLNNMPNTPDSILRHVKVGINGINVPWMYYGSLFTTFCWHNEDNYLYSINYHHKGAPKQWYGVPGTQRDADGLEKVFKSYLSTKMRDIPDLLHHITTQFSPRLLLNADVPIYKLIQHEGEYVVTFPRAFHGGFSYGPNVGEAVNFATHDWIAHGSDANERYRSFARSAVFSHDRLTFTMAHHVSEQKSYRNCKLLLDELDRVVAEELLSRDRLIDSGVRDVSHLIQLPPNLLERLDETSADYDEKRLCHACKHVCFFSAVACECSQSKVSCLRHSHYMCRCPIERRYLMIWSQKEDLQRITQKVREHCQKLAEIEGVAAEKDDSWSAERSSKKGPSVLSPMPPVAVGAMEDMAAHRNDTINTDPYDPSQRHLNSLSSALSHGDGMKSNQNQQVTSDEDRDEATFDDGGSLDKSDY
mmetsp:Transcript_7333/g.17965  ORF Transcript_7333/g.17965 Transcript_7333/m.17965 type:complete len:777 (-) Transcript_7333:236-2566(-)